MKRQWQQYVARIDALDLRERVLLFLAAAAIVVATAWFAALGPMFKQEAALRAQISQQRNNMSGLDGEMAQKVKEFARDPDAAVRVQLEAVLSESAKLGDTLRAMQKGLVAPERMAPLIDTILRANGRLKLVSMRTLPVSSLNEDPAATAPAAKPDVKTETAVKLASVQAAMAAQAGAEPKPASPPQKVAPKAGSLLYRHGVEITLRGNYLDMIEYMNALEGLPTQLFWGGAHLEVEEYPTSRLTLTLYTLSLDEKWLKL